MTRDDVIAKLGEIDQEHDYVRWIEQAKILNKAYAGRTVKLVKVLPISPIGALPPGEVLGFAEFSAGLRGVVASIGLQLGVEEQVLVEGFVVDADTLPAMLAEVDAR
jgi:hypothetical protein